jgi:ABC-2 type transport system ATP-binding protein
VHAIARPFAISLLAALACMSLVGCSANQDVYAGRVVDDTVTLRAPAPAMPSIDLDAGSQADGADAGRRSTVATAVAVTGLGSVVRVTSVSVKPGGTIAPQSGSIRILGEDVVASPEKVKRRIGYMSQKFSLFEDLTVDENLRFYAGVYDLPADEFVKQRAYVLEMAGLVGREKELTANLSVGWKQRLALGAATIHEPELLFLDEPTSGVDPVARRHFWDLLYDLAGQGVTLFVTTHYMEEATQCGRLAFMYAGRIIAEGSPREIREQHLLDIGDRDDSGRLRTASIEDVFVRLVTREREEAGR